MKIELVHDWKSCLTWYSQWSNSALASAGATWILIPEEWRAAVPVEWLAYAAVTLGVLGFVGRIIKQSGSIPEST